MVWDSVGHEPPCQRIWKGLHLIAQVTAFNVLFHIVTDPWPPEVNGYEFCHFPSARVAGDWGIMVGLHNAVLKLVIKGDVHLSSVEY